MWFPLSCSISSNVSARLGGQINPISNTGPSVPMLQPQSLERQRTSSQIKGVSLGTAVIISCCVINFTYLVNARGWGKPLKFACLYSFTLGFGAITGIYRCAKGHMPSKLPTLHKHL